MNHRHLEVWKQAIDFAERIYSLTEQYPRTEVYGLVSQMRRAVVSVSANIAEGAARKSSKEFLQFVYIARGSASELDTLLELSRRTKMIEEEVFSQVQQQNLMLAKMLTALARSLIVRANKD